MITRSDVQNNGTLRSLTSPQMSESPVYSSEISYSPDNYPSSMCELSHYFYSNPKEGNASMPVYRLFDDMLSPSSLKSNHISQSNSTTSSETLIKDKTLPSTPEKVVCIRHDKFGLKMLTELEKDTECRSIEYADPNPLSQDENFNSNCPSPCTKRNFNINSDSIKRTSLDHQTHGDTSFLMYDNEDMSTLSEIVNCNEVLKNHVRKEVLHKQNDTIVCCYRSRSSSKNVDGSETPVENTINPNTPEEFKNQKGKISGLQKKALDLIFNVIDRPSRGLVLHIARELCLHHITVKNFFSNGRRRLRRAAARLNDPERTRRENQKRKEKRRLAALAAASSVSSSEKGGNVSTNAMSETKSGSQLLRAPLVLSPERRALMEKLAVKVQRSVAQKGLTSVIGETEGVPITPTSSDSPIFSHFSSNVLENISPNQLHSNNTTLNERSTGGFHIHRFDDTFFTSSVDTFEPIFSNSESEPIKTPNLLSDHMNLVNYSSQHVSDEDYDLVGQDSQYSPTNWQTLLRP